MDEQSTSDKWIICRICLKASDYGMFPIFGEDATATDLPEQIADFGAITLTETKACPDRICECCLLLLKAARRFRKLCQRSAQQWHELIALNAKIPEMKNSQNDALNNAKYAEEQTEAAHSEKSLVVLEEQQKDYADTADGYVFEVLDNVEDDCVEVDGSLLAAHDAQFIELDENGPMDFLEDNSEENSNELTFYTNSQYEALKHGEEIVAEQQGNLRSEENINRSENEVEINNKIVPITTQPKRCRKKITAARNPSTKIMTKDSEDYPSDGAKKSTKNYVCSFCGNVYNEKSKLTLHLRMHNKVKPHECEICHKRFAQTPQLTRHMNSHTGNRPFKCKFCEASFADPSTCIKHQRIHTQERPYVCETCGKAFSYSNVLKVHVMSHTGEKPYNCKYCGKKFTQSHHRRTHERIHT